MTENKITTETEKTTNTVDVVQKINEMSPRNLQADAVVCPCEDDHRAVYPVRYAYSNLYGNENAKAALPPSIETLLNASSVDENRGFSARLLRQGWIYIFEEGQFPTRNNKTGNLVIFEHQINYSYNEKLYNDSDDSSESLSAKKNGTAEEKFIKNTVFVDEKSGELTISEDKKQYPYLAIKKDVINASFLFSDIELSPYVLKKIIKNKKYRKSFMQFVNLIALEKNDYCIKPTADNISALIEDYKNEEKKFEAFIDEAKKIKRDLPGEYFSEVTGNISVTQNSKKLVNQLQKTLDENENATLVILYDPIGYQKDILSFYLFITGIYTLFQGHWSYPNTVGTFIKKLDEQTKNKSMSPEAGKELKEILDKSIKFDALNKYTAQIESCYLDFQKIQLGIVNLYQDFLTDPMIAPKIGGIQNYVDHVFLIKEQLEKSNVWHSDFLRDLVSYCELHSTLLHPLHSSKAGKELLDLLYSFKQDDDFLAGFAKVIFYILSQDKVRDKSNEKLIEKILPVVKSAIFIFWDSLGYAFTHTHNKLKNISAHSRGISLKGVDIIANKILPAILSYFGVYVSYTNFSEMTGEQFNKLLNKLKQQSSFSINNQKVMEKMFNWKERIKGAGNNVVINLPSFKWISENLSTSKNSKLNKNSNFSFYDVSATTLIAKDVFWLVSGIIGLATAKYPTEFEKSNPLALEAKNIFILQIGYNLFASIQAFVDIQNSIQKYASLVINPRYSTFLNKVKLPEVSSRFSKLALNRLTQTVIILGFALPLSESYSAYTIGNDDLAWAKVTEAFSSLALSLGILALGTEVGVANIYNPIGWVLIIGGILGLIGSYIYSKKYDWGVLEKLLQNCFWGRGSQYIAYGKKDKNSRRKDIDYQLKLYANNFSKNEIYFEVELQEFYNIFFSPKVEIEIKNITSNNKDYEKKVSYKFILPSFKPGVSDIEYKLVENIYLSNADDYDSEKYNLSKYYKELSFFMEFDSRRYYLSNNKRYNELFKQSLEKAVASSIEKNCFDKDGNFIVNFDFEYKQDIYNPTESIPSIFWYYKIDEGKNIISPRRYKDFDLNQELIGFINDKVN
ncbi:toxin VasX [Proteus appendicitidis]|uniref:Toxin VasX N-terminal region domain-containing protein n=1 Tax=Proteus appendicitidis TaxID=3034648 RepID=A0ABY8YAP7_9GAMM|nr:toxin VasX [Proteus sp. HZ0627]WIV89001.1 hypothetical protein QQS39_03035 [Proteus sp. HZ0627]